MKGLVLCSGGLDSTTLLALAISECAEVEALTLSYGQRHQCEIQAAEAVTKHYRVAHRTLLLPDVFRGFGSTLVDADRPNPHQSYEELRSTEGPSPTYVPFRNANFLSVATALAMTREADYVYFGAHADDAHNWAYPDTTPEFIGAMGNAMIIGTYSKVRLRTPFMWSTKGQIVTEAAKLGVPLQLTYSCYEGRPKHCGLCPTCVNRIQAFIQAGYRDPVAYEVDVSWPASCKPWKSAPAT